MANIEQQIAEVEKEISETEYNKATQQHIGRLKAKLARLKGEAEKRAAARTGGGRSFAVKKSGHASAALIGFPSVGKSTLLNHLTNARSATAAYEFTTLDVIPGILYHRKAEIQILDLPGIIRGAAQGRGRGREVIAVARASDLVIFVADVYTPDVSVLAGELRAAGIRLNERPADIRVTKTLKGGIQVHFTTAQKHLNAEFAADLVAEYGLLNADVVIRGNATDEQLIDTLAGNRVYLPGIVALNKIDAADAAMLARARKALKGWDVVEISAEKGQGLQALKDVVYDRMKFMRIYLRPQGGEPDFKEPLIMKAGTTVEIVCDHIHREWKRRFRYANVWGKSARFPGQTVGLDHAMADEDILTVVTRKG
jgi:small GTP-binding protein